MNISFSYPKGNTEILTVFAVVLVMFLVFHFVSSSSKTKRYFDNTFRNHSGQKNRIYFQRLLGFLCFGLIPLFVAIFILPHKLRNFGLLFRIPLHGLYWLIFLSAVIIFMNAMATKNASNLAMYPQIRIKKWDKKLLIISALTWILYLLAYEFMFRSFLLFASLRAFGAWVAIAVNVVIYSLVHVPKGAKEAIGAIPLGALLCYISLSTGSFWVAFFAHVVLALSNEWFSIYYHQEIHVDFSLKKSSDE